MLEEQFKLLVEDVQLSLKFVNQEFANKLRMEEDKNEKIITF